ncbi:hypothetical protein GCM10023094_02320 [Rhodococcus olei]|uniref:Uncharacterized protein n=1 Tax=Rhodococcus olei TaxID=2161675 RepID=A0ABP8NUQ9_9NOCA
MGVLSEALDGMVRAVFAYECDGLDATAVAAIRVGRTDRWVRSVADSGLFTERDVRRVEAAWRADPELLVDALLDGADEVTRRRCTARRVRPVPAQLRQVPAFG